MKILKSILLAINGIMLFASLLAVLIAVTQLVINGFNYRDAYLWVIAGTLCIFLFAYINRWLHHPNRFEFRTKSQEMSCPSCGYSMRGLYEARCPECGAEFTIDQLKLK